MKSEFCPLNLLDDRGSAVIDLIGFGVLLQLPLLALVIQLVSVQHDQLAAEAITREALRSYLLLDVDPQVTAINLATEYRIDTGRIKLEMSCNPGMCEDNGAFIRLKTQIGRSSATGVMQR